MRVQKKTIYLHIDFVAGSQLHLLSGQYNFHSTKNEAPAFVREGGKIQNFHHPYFLSYGKDGWGLRDGHFLGSSSEDVGTWIKISTKGFLFVCIDIIKSILETDYLSLGTNWKQFKKQEDGTGSFSVDRIVKIFANEIEFKNFQESKRNKG